MSSSRTVEVEVGGRRHVVTLTRESGGGRVRVTRDGDTRVVDVCRVADDVVSFVYLDDGAGSHVARIDGSGDAGSIDVHVDGVAVRAVVDGRRRWADGGGGTVAGGSQELVAPMPGKVVRVLVSGGDEVTAGQGVVVVEAMKMENELSAPRAGRVADVRVEPGASVEAGRVLVVIE